MTHRRRSNHKRTMRKNQCGGDELNEQVKQVIAKHLDEREENRAKWLRAACRNPDNCLALGAYGDSIKQYFEDFRNLSYINTSKVKRIGAPSENGFIIELPFTKNGYTAYTVLKSAAEEDADNLMYEYIVGKKFINSKIHAVPTFLETYDLYEYVDEQAYEDVRKAATQNKLNTLDIRTKIRRLDFDMDTMNLSSMVAQACTKNKLICILIQHFDHFQTVDSRFDTNKSYDNFRGDISTTLLQVYFTLAGLRDKYTHYDLHSNNVMLYKPFEGNACILMRYHALPDKVIEFKTEYIAKIIDYGRNYFKTEDNLTTRDVLNQVCKESSCDPNCGEDVGFANIIGSVDGYDVSNYHWIDPSISNQSHDLRFAYCVENRVPGLFVPYTIVYKETTGTPENLTSNLSTTKNINNVVDMATVTIAKLLNGGSSSNQAKYKDWKVVATMDVYTGGKPYKFQLLPATP